MNPATPFDEECGRPRRTQNRTQQNFPTNHTLVSLPDKDALLLLLRLKLIHEERHIFPNRYMVKKVFSIAP